MASFLLQPLMPQSRQHPQHRGTFVAKYNALATTSCIRVLQVDSYFYDIAEAAPAVGRATQRGSGDTDARRSTSQRHSDSAESTSVASRAASARAAATTSSYLQSASGGSSGLSHSVEEIIKAELRKVVREVESAFHDKLRLFTGEFQITRTHRLVLLRVSHVVFFSDVRGAERGDRIKSGAATARERVPKTQRPSVRLAHSCLVVNMFYARCGCLRSFSCAHRSRHRRSLARSDALASASATARSLRRPLRSRCRSRQRTSSSASRARSELHCQKRLATACRHSLTPCQHPVRRRYSRCR